MESVIALGVIAIAIPLILGATTLSARTRRIAEADTHSAWLARTIQQELTEAWQDRPSTMFPTQPDFPNFGSVDEPEVLLFDQDGNFLIRGSNSDYAHGSSHAQAVYLVSLFATEQKPANFNSPEQLLSRVEITVAHSAHSQLAKRIAFDYTVLIPRQIAP